MNSLEAEYSFLAPTWKLPTVGTSSMYADTYSTLYPPSTSKFDSDISIRNNTTYNPRYVPPATNNRTYPQKTNHQQQGGRSMQPTPPHQSYPQTNDQYRNNNNLNFTTNINSNDQYNMSTQARNNIYYNQQIDNRKINHPPPPQPIQKRVQIIDHNRQTPSTDYMSGRESHNSYTNNTHTPEFNQIQQKSKPNHVDMDDNKSDTTYASVQRPNNFNVHEYLYGLSAPDPGSYVSAYKNHQRRIQDEKINRKSYMNEYKNFVQNGGFGPTFGSSNYQTYEEKLDTEKKRKSYSQIVRETNQYKVEEQKRIQNNGGQQRNRINPIPIPKHRRPDATRSHFLSAQESRSETLSRFSAVSPILTTSSINLHYRSNSPALRQSSFDNLHPWNQNDILSGELYIDGINRSSSTGSNSPISTPRRVRFHSRDFIRRRSSTFIDYPTQVLNSNIYHRTESASPRFSTRKSTAKILEEHEQLLFNKPQYHHHSSSHSNIKEKNFITSHSMMNNDIQLPPTAILNNINQPYKSKANTRMSTSSTNDTKKSILIIKSPENLSKTTSRTVHFVPDIISDDVDDDDDQVTIPNQK